LVAFDLERFARRQAACGRQACWRGVLSRHGLFGGLAAALVAEQLARPGARRETGDVGVFGVGMPGGQPQ
jgi:hypothetical protein